MQKTSKILIVGHDDIIENCLYGHFQSQGFENVFSSSKIAPDFLSQSAVFRFFENERPEYIFLGSLRSGGISANQKYAAEFIYSNLESQNNIIHAAYKFDAKKLLFFAGSCVYPKEASQPIKEEYLLTGALEPTNEPYSVAKIAGIKLCQTYKKQYGFNAITAIPATIYGPGSDAEAETAHVIGALIGKFFEAKQKEDSEVIVWGSGKPRREFIYSTDFVEASLCLMEKYVGNDPVNIGCGTDVSIKELASIIQEVSGFFGKISFDKTKPDGAMKKLLDNSKIKELGWWAKTDLKEGIRNTCKWYAETKKAELKI